MVDYFGGDKKFTFYASGAFMIGSFTSLLCGFIGMRSAVLSNYKTTYKAIFSLEEAFTTAFRGGCVMGFSSVGLGLGILFGLMQLYIYLF